MSQAEETRTLLATVVFIGLLAGGAALGSVELLVAIAIAQAVLVSTWALAGAPPGPAAPAPAAEVLSVAGAVLSAVPVDGVAVVDGDALTAELLPASAPQASAPQASAPEAAAPQASAVGRHGGPALPGRIGAVVIGGLAAAGADVAVSVRPHDALSPLLFVLGLALPVMFVHQLARGVVRSRVVESLSGIAVIIVSVVALTSLAQLRHEADGPTVAVAAVLCVGVAVAAAAFVDLIWSRPRYDPDVPRGFTATVVGTVAGAGISAYALRSLVQYPAEKTLLLTGASAAAGALCTVAIGFVAHGLAGSATSRPARLTRPIAFGLLPLALVAPFAYVLLLSR